MDGSAPFHSTTPPCSHATIPPFLRACCSWFAQIGEGEMGTRRGGEKEEEQRAAVQCSGITPGAGCRHRSHGHHDGGQREATSVEGCGCGVGAWWSSPWEPSSLCAYDCRRPSRVETNMAVCAGARCTRYCYCIMIVQHVRSVRGFMHRRPVPARTINPRSVDFPVEWNGGSRTLSDIIDCTWLTSSPSPLLLSSSPRLSASSLLLQHRRRRQPRQTRAPLAGAPRRSFPRSSCYTNPRAHPPPSPPLLTVSLYHLANPRPARTLPIFATALDDCHCPLRESSDRLPCSDSFSPRPWTPSGRRECERGLLARPPIHTSSALLPRRIFVSSVTPLPTPSTTAYRTPPITIAPQDAGSPLLSMH